MYTDDTALTISTLNNKLLEKTSNITINKIYDWLITNKLKLITSKTEFMCYNKLNKNMKIQINNKEIKKVNAHKFVRFNISYHIRSTTYSNIEESVYRLLNSPQLYITDII